jgi:hypothetical protein
VTRAKAAAAAVAFVAVLAVIGTVTYASVRDEPAPPTTTITTSTTVRAPTGDEVALAITAALSQDLEVPLTGIEAACVAGGMVQGLGQERLEEMAAAGAGVDDLTAEEHDRLVRAIVGCVTPETAEALLSTKPPPPPVEGLPDEDVEP